MGKLEEILAQLDAISVSFDDIIAEDSLTTLDGGAVACTIHHGLDPLKARACDRYWGEFNDALVRYVLSHCKEEDRYGELNKLSLEDYHWEWLGKYAKYNSDQYNWFFVFADGKPQAACVIYHPKPSALASGDIFYVDFIATAPWNRENPCKPRVFKGVAPKLLGYAINFAISNLKLRPGFCLQALPKACEFYEKIGMVPDKTRDDGRLSYYEMSESNTLRFLGA